MILRNAPMLMIAVRVNLKNGSPYYLLDMIDVFQVSMSVKERVDNKCCTSVALFVTISVMLKLRALSCPNLDKSSCP